MRKILPVLIALILWGINDIKAQNFEFRDLVDYSPDLSDVWGWSDGEREYALLGLLGAYTVVDVTDPDNIVQLFHATVDGPTTFWRDIKTYGHYAYGVHDGPFGNQVSQGIAIMDLSYLPDSMPYIFYTDNGNLTEAHNIFIDEQGIAYLAGHDRGGSGVLMLDIATDPLNPTIVGQYQNGYVHDLFVRNDTLWTSDGSSSGPNGGKRYSAVDVSDKSNPQLLGSGSTPGNYSHNIWVSDDGKTAFTTDESSGGYVAAHDVSDASDMVEVDRYRSNPGSNVIPHNVFVQGDFLLVSYYRDGVIMLDASFPDEMVEVGSYDTSPRSGNGFNGCWGVYPYLPSGNILAADIEEGLFVLTPTYERAVHIRGTVTDATTGDDILGANISITRSGEEDVLSSDLEGKFKKGYADGGIFEISVSKAGYTTYTDTRALTNGDVLYLDVELNNLNYLGSFVWSDENENGVQDPGEPGIDETIVELYSEAGAFVGMQVTKEDGNYLFSELAPGNYILRFIPPVNGTTPYLPTRIDQGDDALDSDVAVIEGNFEIAPFELLSTGSYTDLDAGFVTQFIPDPVDTINQTVVTGQSITICDDILENGNTVANASSICAASGQPEGSSWNSDTPGCLTFTAGDLGTGPLEICVTTTGNGDAPDTTVFVITVTSPLAIGDNAFDRGDLELLQNPVNNHLYLKNYLSSNEPLTLMINDLSGKELTRIRDNGANRLISMPVQQLSSGLYLITVYSDSKMLGLKRFVKQ